MAFSCAMVPLLWVFIITKITNQTQSSYNFDGNMLREEGKRYLGTYIITSKDNGHTLGTKPIDIDTKDMPFKNVEGPDGCTY